MLTVSNETAKNLINAVVNSEDVLMSEVACLEDITVVKFTMFGYMCIVEVFENGNSTVSITDDFEEDILPCNVNQLLWKNEMHTADEIIECGITEMEKFHIAERMQHGGY